MQIFPSIREDIGEVNAGTSSMRKYRTHGLRVPGPKAAYCRLKPVNCRRLRWQHFTSGFVVIGHGPRPGPNIGTVFSLGQHWEG